MPREQDEQKITKQYVLERTDEDETDLSLCNLSRVPVKELVRCMRKEREGEVSFHFCYLPQGTGTSWSETRSLSEQTDPAASKTLFSPHTIFETDLSLSSDHDEDETDLSLS